MSTFNLGGNNKPKPQTNSNVPSNIFGANPTAAPVAPFNLGNASAPQQSSPFAGNKPPIFG